MPRIQERRKSETLPPVIGDHNRLRRKSDTGIKERLKAAISGTSQHSAYLTPVTEEQIEVELDRGHIRALINRDGEIVAHVRCLPLSDKVGFIMTLYGNSRQQVLEVLQYLGRDRLLSLETVQQHLRDLGLTEADLRAAGFERTTRTQLGLTHLARTNWYYFRNDPLRFLQGFFRKESAPQEYLVFVRRRKQ